MENQTNNTQLVVSRANEQQSLSVFSNTGAFEQAQRFAQALCKSDIVPQAYKNNLPNTLVALEMANRMGESPLMVMQHLDIIHGKPSFGSKFVIGRINTCGKFSPLRFRYSGAGDERTCVAHCKDLATGETLDGPPVSIAMAKKEGWFNKQGSKWQTMPELMLMYRAGTFFGRMYAPELTMGMQTTDELIDITDAQVIQPISPAPAVDAINAQVSGAKKPTKKTTVKPVENNQPGTTTESFNPPENTSEELI